MCVCVCVAGVDKRVSVALIVFYYLERVNPIPIDLSIYPISTPFISLTPKFNRIFVWILL